MDFEIFRYWFTYDGLDFETAFYWGRVLLIIGLGWWLLRRHNIRKREAEQRKHNAVAGNRRFTEEDPAKVKDLVGRLVDKVRGEEAPAERPRSSSVAEYEVEQDTEQESDQLLLDRLPSPSPGRCHLVFLNEDGSWVDIKVQGLDKTMAMVGQKLIATTRAPGTHVFTVTPRKIGAPSRITVMAKDCYCLVELEDGAIKQICSEHGPIAYDKLKI
jgi:hypothetical protein